MNDNETEQNVPISCLIDWKKCLFCQDNSCTLQCPALSKRKDNGAGYRTLIEDLCEFEKLGQLPLQFSLERLGDGAGAVETLCTNTACWHKSCRDQYNKTKLQRAKKRKCSEVGEDNNAKNWKKTTRLSLGNMPGMSTKEDLCFFCEEKASTEVLRSASTFGLDSRVRSAALLLEDEKLLTKLNSGDLIAVEAKYHKKCLTSLYNHARDKRRRQNRHCDDLNMAHSIALAELISYLEDSRVKGEVKVHKLSSLVKDYSVRLTQLGADSDQQVHATRNASKSIKPLPSFYTNVSPVAKSCVQSPTGMLQGSMAFDSNTMSVAIRNEYAWLEQLHFTLKEEEVTNSSDEMLLETRMKPWPVFHSQRKAVQVKPKSASYLLPMFPDCAHSVPMIKHSMKVAVKLTDHANPGQTPVLVCDQPLFALAKQIQWTWPEELGEDHFMVMIGGLHVEMAILAALGSFLDNSGWTEALVLAQVTTSGRAQSLLSGSKVKRTRYAHLVTLGGLSLLQQDSYRKYLTSVEGTEALQFLDWCCYQASRSPQFDYWNTVKEIQI